MKTALSILGLALLMTQALGSIGVALEPCQETCPDDGPDGRCVPFCAQCLCCPHPQPLFAASTVILALPSGPATYVSCDSSSPSFAFRGEILHVPKPRLA